MEKHKHTHNHCTCEACSAGMPGNCTVDGCGMGYWTSKIVGELQGLATTPRCGTAPGKVPVGCVHPFTYEQTADLLPDETMNFVIAPYDELVIVGAVAVDSLINPGILRITDVQSQDSTQLPKIDIKKSQTANTTAASYFADYSMLTFEAVRSRAQLWLSQAFLNSNVKVGQVLVTNSSTQTVPAHGGDIVFYMYNPPDELKELLR